MNPEKRKRPPQPPTDVKLYVALRQLGAGHVPAEYLVEVAVRDRCLGVAFKAARAKLAVALSCPVEQLRIDHTWMLRTRAYKPRKGKPVAGWYIPHAHDPDYLRWRPQGAEFDGSHHVKTNVRGERGQYSDVVLAKRERRRERDALGDRRIKRGGHFARKTKVKRRWPKRAFPKGRGFDRRRP